jgi:hypothetical protein
MHLSKQYVWMLLALAGLLTGCAELDRQRPANVADDDATCRASGAVPGTPAYATCLKDRDIAAARIDQRMQNTHKRVAEDMLNGR